MGEMLRGKGVEKLGFVSGAVVEVGGTVILNCCSFKMALGLRLLRKLESCSSTDPKTMEGEVKAASIPFIATSISSNFSSTSKHVCRLSQITPLCVHKKKGS